MKGIKSSTKEQANDNSYTKDNASTNASGSNTEIKFSAFCVPKVRSSTREGCDSDPQGNKYQNLIFNNSILRKVTQEYNAQKQQIDQIYNYGNSQVTDSNDSSYFQFRGTSQVSRNITPLRNGNSDLRRKTSFLKPKKLRDCSFDQSVKSYDNIKITPLNMTVLQAPFKIRKNEIKRSITDQ